MAGHDIEGKAFFCSWSGGKDSCLALYHAIEARGLPRFLFTMLTEDGARSRSHGLLPGLIELQAGALGIPVMFGSASWQGYEAAFTSALHELKALGVEKGVFGDIDLAGHREWCKRVCSAADMGVFHPLWKRDRRELLDEFIVLGFEATIIAVKDGTLDTELLGRALDKSAIREIEDAGADPSGELGEYHTVVTGGPIFSRGIKLEAGDRVLKDGYWFLDVLSKGVGHPR